MIKNTKIIIASVIVFLLVGAGSYALYARYNTPADPTINLDPATAEQKKVAEDLKERFVVDPEAPPTTVKSPEQAEIIKAYQDNTIGKVVIQTKLPGSSWTSCTIKLASPSGAIVEKSAKAFYQPEYSTCEGFAIERNEFNQTGVWSILLDAKKVDGSHSQASANVTIE